MKRAVAVVASFAAAAALSAGCGSSGSMSPPPAGTTSAPVATEAASLRTAATPLGTILTDASGMTLYLFEADTGTSSTCYDACEGAWPPYTTTATPGGNAGGLNPSMVGTTTRTDHTIQVTYNGHPLYYFAEDTKAGQTNGQGVDAFGAKWFVVSPSGKAITTAASANPSSTAGGGAGGY